MMGPLAEELARLRREETLREAAHQRLLRDARGEEGRGMLGSVLGSLVALASLGSLWLLAILRYRPPD